MTDQCPAVSTSGRRCWYIAGHPTRTHVDLSTGWPHPWSAPDQQWTNTDLTHDPLRDAPAALARLAEQLGDHT